MDSVTNGAGEPLCDLVVVDDDDLSLRLVDRSLRHTTLQYNCFERPQDALVFLQTRQTRILIVDYRMPSINGLELIEKLKGYPSMPAAKVFLASTVTLPKQVQTSAQHLDIHFLVKDRFAEAGFLEELVSSQPR